MQITLSESTLQNMVYVAAVYCAFVHVVRAIRDMYIERQTTKLKLAALEIKREMGNENRQSMEAKDSKGKEGNAKD